MIHKIDAACDSDGKTCSLYACVRILELRERPRRQLHGSIEGRRVYTQRANTRWQDQLGGTYFMTVESKGVLCETLERSYIGKVRTKMYENRELLSRTHENNTR